MVLFVVGRELREYKDKDASSDLGRDVYKKRLILHCTNDPKKIDIDSVVGQQCKSFAFFEGNRMFDDILKLPIPCVINGDVSRNGQYVNLEDFDIITN